MAMGRSRQKAKRKSTKHTRRSLKERHRLGISATARAGKLKGRKSK